MKLCHFLEDSLGMTIRVCSSDVVCETSYVCVRNVQELILRLIATHYCLVTPHSQPTTLTLVDETHHQCVPYFTQNYPFVRSAF